MLRGGISSVSYRNAQAEDIIGAAGKAGLGGIEWSADTHAPHGDVARAEELMMATLRAGLTVSAYGSFYRLGLRKPKSLDFSTDVLACARRLQAPIIRVWAAPAAATENTTLNEIAEEAVAISDQAGRFGITVCLEPHDRSVIADYSRLAETVEAVDHPFFKACWTPLSSPLKASQQKGIELLAPHIALIHVRNWTRSYTRRPLSESIDSWTSVVDALAERARRSVLDHWALIEYLEDDSPATLKRETEALKTLLEQRMLVAEGY
jgi:sugar phosphate isomerase/epimerase